MSQSFEDRLRKAGGIPTQADNAAKAAKLAEAEAEWERGKPERDRVLSRYKTVVLPLIDESLATARKVAGEHNPPCQITETIFSGKARDVLAQRWLAIQFRPANQQQPTLLGSLEFRVSHTGVFQILHSTKHRSGPQPTPVETDIGQVGRANIEDAFEKLLAQMNPQQAR